MWKIRWTDHARNEEVLHTFNENMNILQEIKGRKEGRKEGKKERVKFYWTGDLFLGTAF
jgi:hypothetical protein